MSRHIESLLTRGQTVIQIEPPHQDLCCLQTQLSSFSVLCINILSLHWGGRVVRRCWVNFQCWGVLLIWIIVGQGPIVLAVGAGGGCLDIFSLIYHFYLLSPSLWETARYRLKYCLKGPLNPNQPTNQPIPPYWNVGNYFFEV